MGGRGERGLEAGSGTLSIDMLHALTIELGKVHTFRKAL